MAKKHFIVVNDIVSEEQLNIIASAISSNYVNVRSGENLFLIMSPDNENAKDIFTKLTNQIQGNISIVVIEVDKWYGQVIPITFDWIEEKFPEVKLTRE